MLVSMTQAERAAAVAVLTDIIATWWTRQQVTDQWPITGGEGEVY